MVVANKRLTASIRRKEREREREREREGEKEREREREKTLKEKSLVSKSVFYMICHP